MKFLYEMNIFLNELIYMNMCECVCICFFNVLELET